MKNFPKLPTGIPQPPSDAWLGAEFFLKELNKIHSVVVIPEIIMEYFAKGVAEYANGIFNYKKKREWEWIRTVLCHCSDSDVRKILADFADFYTTP